MKTIWVLCKIRSQDTGMSTSTVVIELADSGWGEHYPAFKSEQAALAYCDDRGLHDLRPTELKVQS